MLGKHFRINSTTHKGWNMTSVSARGGVLVLFQSLNPSLTAALTLVFPLLIPFLPFFLILSVSVISMSLPYVHMIVRIRVGYKEI